MISISKPQGAAQAKDYPFKESYYQQNCVLGEWHGHKLALQYLGLHDSDAIDKKTYASILNGIHPQNGKYLLSNSGSEKRRAGIDITFSAPKSVSLLMSLCEGMKEKALEKDIRIAHEEAVQYAMDKLSRYYAKTRIRKGKGKREMVTTKALWASFQHDTTRETDLGEIDPQLHTHNFLMALTFYKDPNTRKLTSYSMSNEEIYINKMYLGQVYRNALADNLSTIGLQINVTDINQGFFELKDFSQQQLDVFSGRHTELLEKLAKSEMKSDNRAKLLDLINSKTKKHKRKIDREALISKNKERMKLVGIDRYFLDRIIANNQVPRQSLSKKLKDKLTMEHLNKSLDLLEEHYSVFCYEEIIRNALKFGLKYGFILNDYQMALEEMMKQGRLIKLDQNVYSTKAIVDAERDVIHLMIQGKRFFEAYTKDEKIVHNFIAKSYSNMTKGQREMVGAVIGTEDQFVAIQGDAGSGKTYSASAIKDFMTLHSPLTEVIGLAFTGKAAQSLEVESEIASSTLHSFLYQEEKDKTDIPKRRLIIVDEAGTVGSLQIAKLMKIAKKNEDRVVFIGDTKQFSSVAAGNIFLDMQTYGIHTVYMSETMRQKSDYAKGIVKAIKSRKIEKAIGILTKRGLFREMDKYKGIEEIAQTYSQTYSSIDPLCDELIIASRNVDRISINEIIRRDLGKESEGELYTVKEAWSQNGVGRYFTKKLEEGMVIVPSKITGTKNGSEYRISAILDEKHIEMVTSGGKRVVIDFYKYSQQCQIYREVQKEFTPGETIIFTKNTSIEMGAKVKNGERAVIESIKNGIIQTTEGKRVKIEEVGFIDYGYAITDFKSQGTTTKNVIIFADAQMASMNAFYTQVTRAKENITVYTDNKDALLANLKKDATQHSTLEYTMNGKKIEQKNKLKENIAQNIRGKGKVLSSIEFNGEKTAMLLGLSSEKNHKNETSISAFMQKIADVIEKVDLYLDTFKSKLKPKSDDNKQILTAIKSLLPIHNVVEDKQAQSSIKIKV